MPKGCQPVAQAGVVVMEPCGEQCKCDVGNGRPGVPDDGAKPDSALGSGLCELEPPGHAPLLDAWSWCLVSCAVATGGT